MVTVRSSWACNPPWPGPLRSPGLWVSPPGQGSCANTASPYHISADKYPLYLKQWVIDHRGAGIGPTSRSPRCGDRHSNRLGPVGQLRPRLALYEPLVSQRPPHAASSSPPSEVAVGDGHRSSYRREGAATYLSLHPSFPITRNQELHLDSYRPTGCTPWWMPHSSIQGGASRAATSLI